MKLGSWGRRGHGCCHQDALAALGVHAWVPLVSHPLYYFPPLVPGIDARSLGPPVNTVVHSPAPYRPEDATREWRARWVPGAPRLPAGAAAQREPSRGASGPGGPVI